MELFSQAGWEASVQVMLVGALQGLYFAIDKMGKSLQDRLRFPKKFSPSQR